MWSVRIALISVIFFGLNARADIISDFENKVDADIRKSHDIMNRVKASDRSLCPTVKSNDMSTCFRAYVKATPIKSSAFEIGLLAVAVTAAQIDKKLYDPATAALVMLDNSFTVFESADLKKFYSSEYPVSSSVDYVGSVFTKQTENDIQKKKNREGLSPFRRKISEIEKRIYSKPLTGKLGEWHKEQLKRMQTRLTQLENKSFYFSDEETTVQRDVIWKYNLDEKTKHLCKFTNKCTQVSLEKCTEVVSQTVRDCTGPANSRTPASMTGPDDAQTYLKTINDCLGPAIQPIFKKLAPSC